MLPACATAAAFCRARAPRAGAPARASMPPFAANWAFFLDIDGTLLDIEGHPDEVRIERPEAELVAGRHPPTGGGLALVGGRPPARGGAPLLPPKMPLPRPPRAPGPRRPGQRPPPPLPP